MFCTCETSHFLFSFSLIQPIPIANKKVLLIKKKKKKEKTLWWKSISLESAPSQKDITPDFSISSY